MLQAGFYRKFDLKKILGKFSNTHPERFAHRDRTIIQRSLWFRQGMLTYMQ